MKSNCREKNEKKKIGKNKQVFMYMFICSMPIACAMCNEL